MTLSSGLAESVLFALHLAIPTTSGSKFNGSTRQLIWHLWSRHTPTPFPHHPQLTAPTNVYSRTTLTLSTTLPSTALLPSRATRNLAFPHPTSNQILSGLDTTTSAGRGVSYPGPYHSNVQTVKPGLANGRGKTNVDAELISRRRLCICVPIPVVCAGGTHAVFLHLRLRRLRRPFLIARVVSARAGQY